MGPIQLVGRREGLQQAMQGRIKPLALAIPVGVLWGGVCLLYTIETAKLLDQLTLEVLALIRMYSCQHPKPVEPFLDQHPRHHGGSLVSRRHSLCEF